MPISLDSHPTLLKTLRYARHMDCVCCFFAGIWITHAAPTCSKSACCSGATAEHSFLYSWGS